MAERRGYENIIAKNKILNGTISQGLELVEKIKAAGLAHDPRLYANQVSGLPALMVPLTAEQDNSDLPDWVGGANHNLTDLGVPHDLPIYLQVWLTSARGNFYNVAQVCKTLAMGIALDAALQ